MFLGKYYCSSGVAKTPLMTVAGASSTSCMLLPLGHDTTSSLSLSSSFMLGIACFALELVGLADDAAWSLINAGSPTSVANWLLAHGLYVAVTFIASVQVFASCAYTVSLQF